MSRSRFSDTDKKLPVSAVVLTFNEEPNIGACLRSLAGWTSQIYVVDSGSTDKTKSIAEHYGAIVIYHQFESYMLQWKWALQNLPLNHEWILGLDADQSVTAELRLEFANLFANGQYLFGDINGFYMKRRQVFRGTWIRHGGYYPKYLLKLFRASTVYFDEQDFMDHHFYVTGRVAKLKKDFVEDNKKEYDIAFWIEKHNRYAPLHAKEEMSRRYASATWPQVPTLFGNPDQRVMWLKRGWFSLPLFVRPILYFIYRYFLRLGFLDGKQGFIFHFMQAFWYRLLVDIHLDDLSSRTR